GPRLACPPSPLDLPFHANLLLLAQRGGRLLRQTDQAKAQTWRVLLGDRAAGCHKPLHRGAQPRAQAFRLEERPRCYYRRRQSRVPNVGVNPLGSLGLLASAAVPSLLRAEWGEWFANLGEGVEDFWLAAHAYVYGYPLVTIEMTRRVMTNLREPG